MSIGYQIVPKGRPLPGKGELRSRIDSAVTIAINDIHLRFKADYDKKIRDVQGKADAAAAVVKAHAGLVQAVQAYRAWIVLGEGETSARAVAERMEAVWKALEEVEKCSISSAASSK